MKKLSSLLLALVMCLSLCVPAFAENKDIYLDGYADWAQTVESTEEAAQLRLTGDLEKTGALSDENGDPICPIYTANGPMTVTLVAGVTPGGDPDVNSIAVLDVHELTFDEETAIYDVKTENVAYFDGRVAKWNYDEATGSSYEDLCSIEEFAKNPDSEMELPAYCKGAKLTLSTPGIYMIQARYEANAGSCTVVIYVTEGSAETEQPEEKPATAFTDVAADSPFAPAIAWAVEKKITTGTSATTFSPKETCNTAQILTFLWRAKGEPAATAENPFTDVTNAEAYYYNAALWAAENGLVSGTTFGEKTDCTRAAVVTYLWKLAGSPEVEVSTAFTDVAADAEYAQAVAWAVENEITQGTSTTTFGPSETCTRGQIVTFLYRAYAE